MFYAVVLLVCYIIYREYQAQKMARISTSAFNLLYAAARQSEKPSDIAETYIEFLGNLPVGDYKFITKRMCKHYQLVYEAKDEYGNLTDGLKRSLAKRIELNLSEAEPKLSK